MSLTNLSKVIDGDKRFHIEWIDDQREPRVAPNPEYPSGKDLDVSMGAKQTCTVELPCPARRCGIYAVVCKLCGLRVGCTTAGRPDDPRSMTIACKVQEAA